MRADFLGDDEIAAIGFARVGEDVRISRQAVFFGAAHMSIGRNTRIDAFCVLSAGEKGLSIGRNVHISCHTTIVGQGEVSIGDFATLSVRCAIFSSNDDYSGASMTNPTVPGEYRHSSDEGVAIGEHAIIGAGSVVLPGTRIGASAAVGALSMVNRDIPPTTIYAGVPAKFIRDRSSGHLELCRDFLRDEATASQGGTP
jgi:acetyltransferase-like isoleucine patch superfamily enzyme